MRDGGFIVSIQTKPGKTGEAAQGIGRLADRFPRDHPYRRRLAGVRARFGDIAYPGSPVLAAMTLGGWTTMHLAELHPREVAALREVMLPWGAHVRQRRLVDGAGGDAPARGAACCSSIRPMR